MPVNKPKFGITLQGPNYNSRRQGAGVKQNVVVPPLHDPSPPPEPIDKGVTMSPPGDYYQNVDTYFEINDDDQEITFVETPGSTQGEAFTIGLIGGWNTGFGNTPSTVQFTLRSPPDWVAGNASNPNIFFSWQDGFVVEPLSEDLTITFTEANQSLTETVNWIGGNSDIEFISPVADGVDIGFIIENIVFDPEPSPS